MIQQKLAANHSYNGHSMAENCKSTWHCVLRAFTLWYASMTTLFGISYCLLSFIKSSCFSQLFSDFKRNDVIPLLHHHYSNFVTTTDDSAPTDYFSTFSLAVLWLALFRFSLTCRFPCFTQKPNTCSCHLNAVPQIISISGIYYPYFYQVVTSRFCGSLTFSTLLQWFTFVHLHVSHLTILYSLFSNRLLP